ncbi:hypothetical protein [Chitinibacter bivalviorum]|uniref:hypothetical protein n=1 Tax=Chitinibacter bivalviorum TaxID=2739434 RepID=UPI001C5350A9|nr:hypothetical protein [Chitinibacter bivalviorum]
MDVSELLNQVKDSESFLVFVRALAADRADSVIKVKASPSHPHDSDGRESTTIESFLKSAIAWAEDSNFGLTQGLPQSNPWRQFAVFLYCGKIYE